MAPTIARSSSSPSGESGARSIHLAALALVLVIYAGVTSLGLNRPGYSIDEEITYAAAHGIAAHGVPRLPSGILENRGLLFSYAAWLSGAIFGQSLPAYRVPSLISGVIAIMLVFRLSSIALPAAGAVLTAAAVALLPWQIIGGQWARFYAMFLACVLWSFLRFWDYLRTGRGLGVWLASVALAHSLHDFAIALVFLPGVVWLVNPPIARPRLPPWKLATFAAGAFLATEIALLALHVMLSAPPFRTPLAYARLHAPVAWQTTGQVLPEPTRVVETRPVLHEITARGAASALAIALLGTITGVVLARAVRVSPALGAFTGALGAFAQFGQVWFVTSAWALADSARMKQTVLFALTIVSLAIGALAASLHWTAGSALTTPFAKGLAAFALGEFTSVYRGLAATYPLSSVAFFLAGAVFAWRGSGQSVHLPRLLFIWSLCWLYLYFALGVEFKPRYWICLWPLLIIAIMHVQVVGRGRTSTTGAAVVAPAIVLAAILSWEQYRAADENRVATCVASRRVCLPSMLAYPTDALSRLKNEIRPGDTVLCGDEVLCEMTLGRSDYWLYSGLIFSYPTSDGALGLFGGSPIVRSLPDLAALLAGRGDDARFWVIVPALRKYANWTMDEILPVVPDRLRERMRVIELEGATVLGPA